MLRCTVDVNRSVDCCIVRLTITTRIKFTMKSITLSSVVGYQSTFRWLTISISIVLTLLIGVPIYSSNLKHSQFLALRNARNALLEKEFYLKMDKEDVNKDIVELNARLDSKYRRLDSICQQLIKEVDLSIRQMERDML